MSSKKLKFVVGAILIVGAIGYLISTSINQTSMYFVTVSELSNRTFSYSNAAVKVKGNVVKGSIERDPQNYLLVNFSIEDKENKDKTNHLKVQYQGVTPDMFQDEGEVVVEGIVKNGVFHANTLLTSCPSKYEAEKQAGKSHPGDETPYKLKKPEFNPAPKATI